MVSKHSVTEHCRLHYVLTVLRQFRSNTGRHAQPSAARRGTAVRVDGRTVPWWTAVRARRRRTPAGVKTLDVDDDDCRRRARDGDDV